MNWEKKLKSAEITENWLYFDVLTNPQLFEKGINKDLLLDIVGRWFPLSLRLVCVLKFRNKGNSVFLHVNFHQCCSITTEFFICFLCIVSTVIKVNFFFSLSSLTYDVTGLNWPEGRALWGAGVQKIYTFWKVFSETSTAFSVLTLQEQVLKKMLIWW